MWLSGERTKKRAVEPAAEWGPVTVTGPSAVYLGGERRQVPVCCPGGYAWRPAVGDQVLVIKAGAEGEQPFILGKTGDRDDLEPGQVRLGSAQCGVLCGDRLELTGDVLVNGEGLEALVRRVLSDLMAPEWTEE